MTTIQITIEQLEALAAQAENDVTTEHARMVRLCKAMARILAVRQPEAFERFATSITDVAGHWDNSYPPKAEYHFSGAPRLIRVRAHETDDVPTSRGFYHNWRRQTDDLGIYVARDGSFLGCNETGTGAFGQYAAHPGDCRREIERDWVRIEPTLDQLREAEEMLRAKMAQFLEGVAA